MLDREGNYDLTLGGALTYAWSKRRVLLNNEDRTYLSNIEKVKAKLVNSTAIQLNNTNNLLNIANTSTYQLSNGDEIYYEFITHSDIKTGSFAPIFCKRQTDSQPGNFILNKDDNNLVYVRYWNKTNTLTTILSNVLTLQANTHYCFCIKIENNIFKFYNHGILLASSNEIDLTDLISSDSITLDGQLNSSIYNFKSKILKFCIKRNENYLYYSDFTYNTNNTCYDQVTGTPYTILGDPVSIVNNDILHSRLRKGFSRNVFTNNIIQNPSFDDNSVWYFTDNAYIDTINKVGVLDANITYPSRISQPNILKANTYYKVEFDVLEFSGDITYFRPYLVGVNLGGISGTGHKVVFGTSTSAGQFQFLMSGQGRVIIDNVDVREYNTTEYIPPSLTDTTKDIFDNILTNPPKTNAHNYANTSIDLSRYVNIISEWHPNGTNANNSYIDYKISNNIIEPIIYNKIPNTTVESYLQNSLYKNISANEPYMTNMIYYNTDLIEKDTIFDFTENGSNSVSIELNNWKFGDITSLDNVLFFYRKVYNNKILIGTTEHLILSTTQPIEEFAITKRYYKKNIFKYNI